jgi:hypothetical protein
MYWEHLADAGVALVYKSMLKNHFREVKLFVHLNDNSKIGKAENVFKVRLFF